MKPWVRTCIAAAVAARFLAPEAVRACAVCGVDGEPGFLWSMGFLIAMPFVIAALAGSYFAYHLRRSRRAAAGRGIFSE